MSGIDRSADIDGHFPKVSNAGALAAAPASGGGLDINLATGQDASGHVQTTGDLPDANWTVANADNYQNAPIAYTVAPGDADWSPYWLADGPNSSWIAADPNAGDNGNMTFTLKFDLTGYNPADVILSGGQFAADDIGAVYLNGHQIGADASRNWEVLHPLSTGAGDFVAGVNTLVVQITDADKIGEAVRLEGAIVEKPVGGFQLDLATGQDTSGNIQTAGDLPDANWTVTNADNYKNAPIAYTVAPGNADWYGNWMANGPSSSWIAADPNTNVNGNVTYTITFNLSGYNPAYATLAGGKFMVDDACTISLNGHVLGSEGFNGWQNGFAALSTGAGDFLAGVNTLVIQTTGSDHNDEAARLEGTIVDTVTASTPIRWASAVSGSFATAANWTGGVAPGPANDAILEPRGAAFTVTASASQSVNSIQTAVNASLDIAAGTFTATLGTGAGSNGGAIVVGDGAAFAFAGTLANIGSIDLQSAGHATVLSVGGSGGALVGGGAVSLSDDARNLIVAGTPGAALTNVDNTITGAGEIGGGLRLANGATGVIDATGQSGLVIALGSNPVENAGLMEATGAGGLILRDSTIDGSSGGGIAAGNGSHVALQGADLIGGTLRSTGSGVIWTYLGANQLDGRTSAVTNQARLILHNSTALALEGAIVNTNQIGLDGFGGDTRVVVGAAGATLSGGGLVILNDHADNIITGADAAATLTNVDNVITGAGQLGLGSLTLINEAAGLIVGSHAVALILDTGANTIVNAGRIVADGAGGVTIKSAVESSGLLEVQTGVMTVEGAVSGAGAAVISGGTLDFTSSFTQKVVFRGASGILELAQSQAYTGLVVGFSTTGGTALDLGDIGFVSSTEATFAGTASGGTLTVTDGSHTAHIALKGDYTASTFIASSDGHGGTIVIDPTAPSSQAAAHRFVAAAAGLGARGGGHLSVMHEAWRTAPTLLGRPAVMTA